MEKMYNVEYLPTFFKELHEIIYYITYKLNNKRAAKNLINNIEVAIQNRKINPEVFELYKSKKNKRYKWYRIYINNFIIFYTVKNNKMIVSHIFYSRRNIENLI